MKLSIAIPFHQTEKTAFYLSRLLKSIEVQSFKDYEIVLTSEGAMAHNHNAAILASRGEIVQMMQMDDYFAHPEALRAIYEGLQGKEWQITACLHSSDNQEGWPHVPHWTHDIYTGNNRLGSISTLSFRRENQLLFEEPLQWLLDADVYYRYFLKYGPPNLLQTPNVVIDTRNDRMTHTIPDDIKRMEVEYLRKKYE